MNQQNETAGKTIRPATPDERIQIIDIIRGFALFGILLVNMDFFNDSIFGHVLGWKAPGTFPDQLGRWFISFFGAGKFYSIFSFLFGLGMGIQLERAAAKGMRFTPFFLRRMAVLLGIGILHAYLIWAGDILILYSLLGMVLVLIFKNRKPKTLVVWTVLFLLVPILLNSALLGLVELGRMVPEGREAIEQAFAEQEEHLRTNAVAADAAYGSGGYWETTRQRVKDMRFMYNIWPFMMFNVMAMFTLGLAAAKKRVFHNLNQNRPLIGKTLFWGCLLGVTGNLLFVTASHSSTLHIPSVQTTLSVIGQTLGAPALALFYMSFLTSLTLKTSWMRRLIPLASVGRMAITNYLMQSIVCTLLFYGYGFGLYGKLSIIQRILLTILIYAVQIPVSVWWLKRYRFGPVEWLWRTATYGRVQPMRR